MSSPGPALLGEVHGAPLDGAQLVDQREHVGAVPPELVR
jgi:hypothetical protein